MPDSIYQGTKVINLTAAMVSMLSLETAMLAQFGGDDVTFRQRRNFVGYEYKEIIAESRPKSLRR